MNSLLRPIHASEIILEKFAIFAQEELGKEKFTLICLLKTAFFLNAKSIECEEGSVISLPEKEWTLENDVGSFIHFEFHHILRNLSLTGNTWQELSDVLKVQKFEAPNTTVTQLDEDGLFCT